MNYTIQSGKTIDEAVSKALDELKLTRNEVEIEVIEEPSKGFLGILGGKDAVVKVSKIIDTQDILNEFLDPLASVESTDETEKEAGPIETPEPAMEAPTEETSVEDTKQVVESTDKASEEDTDEVEEDEPEETSSDQEVDYERYIHEFMERVLTPLKIDYELEIKRKKRNIYVNILGAEEDLGIVIGKRGSTLDAIQYILSIIINQHSDVYLRIILDCSNYRAKREKTLIELAHRMGNRALKSGRPVKLEPMNAAERRIIHTALQELEGVRTHSEGQEPYRRVIIQKERKY